MVPSTTFFLRVFHVRSIPFTPARAGALDRPEEEVRGPRDRSEPVWSAGAVRINRKRAVEAVKRRPVASGVGEGDYRHGEDSKRGVREKGP